MSLTRHQRIKVGIETFQTYFALNRHNDWRVLFWPVRIVECCGECVGTGRQRGPSYGLCPACRGSGYPNGVRPDEIAPWCAMRL